MLTRNNHSERWLNYCTSLASQTTGAWLLPLRWRQPGDVANCSCQRCKQSQYYSPQRCSDWTHQSRCTGNRYKNIYLSTQWLKSKCSKRTLYCWLFISQLKTGNMKLSLFFLIFFLQMYLISIYIKKFTFKNVPSATTCTCITIFITSQSGSELGPGWLKLIWVVKLKIKAILIIDKQSCFAFVPFL